MLLFNHPLFRQYRDNAPRWCKTLVDNALTELLGARMVTHNGPSTVTVSLLHQPEHKRYIAHVLHYIPVRKSATVDIIEEPSPIDNLELTLHLPEGFTKARLVPEGTALPVNGNTVTIPHAMGYAVVELT